MPDRPLERSVRFAHIVPPPCDLQALPQLVAQSPLDCLGRLLEEGFVRGGRCTAAQMRALARMVDGARTCTLHYAEARQALPVVEALLA